MIIWIWLSATVVLLDQLSKHYMTQILSLCEPGTCESIVLLPIFKLTLLHNEGAAFSFLDDAGGWQRWLFTSISGVVSVVLLVWIARLQRSERLLAISLALILGGAVGNLVDRVALGYVIDFIVVHYNNNYFPAFNVADSAISIGAALMILDMLFSAKRNKNEPGVAGARHSD